MRKRYHGVVALAALALATAGRLGAQAESLATLTTTKPSYLSGEPIALNLRVTNNSASTLNILGNYPEFAFSKDNGIKLGPIAQSRMDRVLAPRQADAPADIEASASNRGAANQPYAFSVVRIPGKYSSTPVQSRAQWSVELYLQSYMKDLPVGVHEVAYSINLDAEPPKPAPPMTIEGRGVLRIVVTPAAEGELAGVLSELGERFKTADWQVKRESEEALSIANSPLVLPYLRGLVRYGLTASPVLALAKFKGNPEAEELALTAALESSSWRAIPALSVLAAWDYPLKEADFGKLLSKADPSLKDAALAYAEKINDLHYLSAVSACTADADPAVARDAKHVEDQLKQRGEWR